MIVLMQVVRVYADCSRPAKTWRLKTQTGSTRSILRRRLCANAAIDHRQGNQHELGSY